MTTTMMDNNNNNNNDNNNVDLINLNDFGDILGSSNNNNNNNYSNSYNPQQQALVPHYGPSSNSYGNYSLPNNNNNNYYYAPQPPPMAPVSPRRVGDFTTTSNTTTTAPPTYPPDYLTTKGPAPVFETTTPTPSMQSSYSSSSKEEEDNNNNNYNNHDNGIDDIPSCVPPEVIAAQERALAEIRQQKENRVVPRASRELALPVPIHVPESANPMGSDAIHPHKMGMKAQRQVKTVVGATTGAIVGGIVTLPVFPLGMVAGGAVGGYTANKLSKFGERRAQRQWEQQSFQHGAMTSKANQGSLA